MNGRRPRAPGAAGLLLLLTLAAPAAARDDVTLRKGLRAVRLLGAATAEDRGVHPGPGVAGRAEGELWIPSGPDLYEVRTGTWVRSGAREPVSGLALLGDELLAVTGSTLRSLRKGTLVPIATLPFPGMRLLAREDGLGLLLFGGRTSEGGIFQIFRDETYVRLVKADRPVTALAESAGELLFASGPDLFLVPLGGTPMLLYRAEDPIVSLAVDPQRGIPYLATLTGVYALTGEGAIPLVVASTGLLHHDGEFLVIADPAQRRVLALRDPAADLHTAAASAPRIPRASTPRAPRAKRPAPLPSPPAGGSLDFLK